jgi:hypothetical protein
MATTTSLTSTYAGREAAGYIRAAFLSNESLAAVTFKENIEYKQVVRKLVDSITFANATCDFTPTGTVTLTERILTLDEKKDFANEAIKLRWENNKNVKNISLNDMILPKREGDMGDDMWKVFNVVQEKLVRGGLIYRTDSGRNVRTRQLTDVVGNTKFNRELWELASSY